MKLVIAVVQGADADPLLAALTQRGYRATQINSAGGFLREQNVTLLIGVQDEHVADVQGDRPRNCYSRSRYVNPLMPNRATSEFYIPNPVEVLVGVCNAVRGGRGALRAPRHFLISPVPKESCLDIETVIARGLQILTALGGAYLLATWFVLAVWTFRDIESRSRNVVTQVFSTLLVVLFWVPGWLLYRLLRPSETLDQAYQRSLEEEYLLQDLQEMPLCPTCNHYINDEWRICPHCNTQLREDLRLLRQAHRSHMGYLSILCSPART
jgi:uncharacterized protein YaaQ